MKRELIGTLFLVAKNGETVTETYARNTWKPHDGIDLTIAENREKLMDICPILKTE